MLVVLCLKELVSFSNVSVAFQIYDIDQDGFISNGELFQVLKMMVGNNLKEVQLQQIVDKTILQFDKDGDGKISFQEFCDVSCFFAYFNWFSYGTANRCTFSNKKHFLPSAWLFLSILSNPTSDAS